jgi:hypothetical protein
MRRERLRVRGFPMPACCDAPSHPWDRWQVERLWMPKPLRCLIVGENPDDVTSQYFYEAPLVASGQGIDALG